MIPPHTNIRFINVLTGVASESVTHLPRWLVLERLRDTPKVHVRDRSALDAFGYWDCMIYTEDDTVIVRLCPAGLEDTLQHLHDLVGGAA